MDSSIETDVKTHVHRAKVTVTEFSMLEGILAAQSSPDGGKTSLNQTISSMEADNMGLKQTDIHTGLWMFVSKVLSGRPF